MSDLFCGQRVFLKEVFELSNYIDRSQLPSSLGGYLIYCHKSWAAFVKVGAFCLFVKHVKCLDKSV